MMMNMSDNGTVDHSGHMHMDDHSGHHHMDTTTAGMNMGHGSHMGHGSGDMGMDHGMMKMYFHTGISEYILFQDCFTESKGAMVGACLIMFCVAIMYEGLKFLREVLLQRTLRDQTPVKYHTTKSPTGTSQEAIVMDSQGASVMNRILSCDHMLQSMLHVVQVFISYCLMLVFMTYNVWLCLAVVLGAGCGYFLFGWKRAVVVDSNEHCH